jgi:hypothetical protein
MLIILQNMTHQYAKPVRKKLRELVGLAYEREYAAAKPLH